MNSIFCSLILGHGLSIATITARTEDTTAARPTTGTISPAYPEPSSIAIPRRFTEVFQYDIRIPLTFRVSGEGKVEQVTCDFVGDSLFQPILDSLCRSIHFRPGLRDGNPVEQVVPGDIYVRLGGKYARLGTPVTDSGKVTSAAWYRDMLAANGLSVPAISIFSSYFCPILPTDSFASVPVVILKVKVGKSGKPRSINVFRSSFPAVDDQLVAATNWSSFKADLSGTGAGAGTAEFYLVFALHPAMRYPTFPVTGAQISGRPNVERALLQVFPDTLGLALLPLPRQLQCDSVVVGDVLNRLAGRISVWLQVDSTGSTQIVHVSRHEREMRNLVSKVLKHFSFYPALGFDLRPRNFVGLLYLDLVGSTNVRIHIDWLAPRESEPIR